jgi:subtilisin-like proprotein convertase family protein
MIQTVIEKAMRIGRATLFLPAVIYPRMYEGHPGAAPTATRGMPIGGDLRRSTRTMPDLRGLIVLSVVSAVAALLLVAAPASADSFSNPTPITVAGGGKASPYPSEIAVSGMTGPITDVNVILHRFGHTRPDAMDILLVSPSGDDVMLMSDACGADDIEDYLWTFDQQAPRQMSADSSDCGEFTYRPTNHPGSNEPDFFGTLHPPPYGASLNDFNNENPNGTWRLYMYDDEGGGMGDIEGGWSLTLSTGPVDVAIPGTGTSGPANPYPTTSTFSTSPDRVISNLNVSIDGIFHQRPDDLDMLLVGPQGQKVILMSDACGSFEVAAHGWVWDDEAPAPMPDGDATNRCGTTSHRPADYEPGESLPTPAPAGPYSTSLSAFDGTDPNGQWQLFVQDDAAGATGFFTNRFQLQISTVPKPDTTAPTVESIAPTGKDVSPKANLRATFSEAMDQATITKSTFKLVKKGTTRKIAATVSYDAATNKAILNPAKNLKRGAAYKATVTTGAKELAGNRLDQKPGVSGNQQKVWVFTVKN